MNFTFVIHAALGLGLFHGLLLAAALWRRRELNPAGFDHLIIAILAALGIVTEEWAVSSGIWVLMPHIMRATTWAPFLLGPAIWLFACSMAYPARHWRDWLHYLPALTAFLAMTPFYLQSGADKIVFVSATQSTTIGMTILGVLKALSIFGYLLITVWWLRSDPGLRHTRLARFLVISIAAFLIAVFAVIALFAFEHVEPDLAITSDLAGAALLAVLLYSVSLVVLYHWTSFAAATEEKRRSKGSQTSNAALLDEETAAAIFSRLRTRMIAEDLHHTAGLDVAGLAEQLGIATHYLSFVINTQTGKSVPAWLNALRIEDAKRALQRSKDASVLEIGLAVGFNSKAAFYRAFRSEVGMTPTAFRASHFPK